MITMRFQCRLLSDVVLNQKSNTEGENKTLDFIPGNVFLGIVASHYADFGNDKAMRVFHSGSVRFGDAHPIAENSASHRTLRVPASLYYPKLKQPSDICYVHHLYDRSKDPEKQQLKQCRNGFYDFSTQEARMASVEKAFAIKSAYDRDKRRSKDEMMYGYESLRKGMTFLFEIEVDDALADLANDIKAYVLGKHRVGRSRTAQYGLVEITEQTYTDIPSTDKTVTIKGDTYVTVYADSRLIFLDENGEPTFRPTPQQLGLSAEDEIKWDYCQLRTFQYAPWNGIRSTRDTDRCGIEKGSVFVVKVKDKPNGLHSHYVGSYKNEGFGKVIYNPHFLASNGANGEATYRLSSPTTAQDETTSEKPLQGTSLLNYLASVKRKDEADRFIYEAVNRFVHDNASRFRGERFASQWGAIRTYAMQCKTYQEIERELFSRTKTVLRGKDNERREEPDAYLTHGIAKEQWNKQKRKEVLKQFVEDVHSKENKHGDIVCRALINLSAEMAKKCRKEESNG